MLFARALPEGDSASSLAIVANPDERLAETGTLNVPQDADATSHSGYLNTRRVFPARPRGDTTPSRTSPFFYSFFFPSVAGSAMIVS